MYTKLIDERSKALSENAARIADALKEYLKHTTPRASFSVSDEEQKELRAAYRKLSAEILRQLGSSEAAAADISKLICKSDLAMNNELTSRLCRIFEAFCAWREAIGQFFENSKPINAKNGCLKLSEARGFANTLLNETTSFMGILELK